MPHCADTIAAVSTPAGRAPLAIVRLSGDRAWELARGLVWPDDAAMLPERCPDYAALRARLGLASCSVRIPAELYLMRRPRSYTREDIVEIHMVGAPPLVEEVLEALLAAGARLADPGEFTRRAFLNGRIDLTQAEAVCSIIRSRSDAEHRAAVRLLEGGLFRRVREMREELLALCAQVEAGIDFADQDIEIISADAAAEALVRARGKLAELAQGGRSKDVQEEAVRVVLCGPVNAGKSSLFNALLGEDRVIVASVPGTTRDTVEAVLEIHGVRVRLTDTAGGWRGETGEGRCEGVDDPLEGEAVLPSPLSPLPSAPADQIERSAQERARAQATRADIVVLVLDGSRPLDAEEGDMIRSLDPSRSLVVLNKADLKREIPDCAVTRLRKGVSVLALSARTGAGVGELRERLAGMVWEGGLDLSAAGLALNARHRQAIRRAMSAIVSAVDSTARQMSVEFVALDLREALDALGEIVGETVSDDILDRIFAEFCIGK